MMEVVLIPKLSYPRHPSPNVRYYFLLGLAEKDLKNKANYYHQLAGKNDCKYPVFRTTYSLEVKDGN